LAALEKQAQPFMAMFETHEERPLAEFLRAHLALAEWLAETPEQGGDARLWQGDAGEQLAGFLAELLENAGHMPPILPAAYPSVLNLMLMAQTYRPRFGSHPRLHILGPIEARLQHFDRIIMGGLNEGDWPGGSPADPWMSRPMRQAFGLPSPERAAGQSAHDLAMLCASPEIFLTRAQKVEGSPTIASRWLVRLHTLIEGLDASLLAQLDAGPQAMAALAQLDAPAAMAQFAAPAAQPPVSARPRRLYVTAIDKWVADPYAFYAQYILGLRKLEALDEEPDAADFGTLVHAALEAFTKANPTGTPPDIEGQLLACGRQAFAGMVERPAVRVLWWPRYEAMVPWLAQQESQRRGQGAQCYAEVKGSWQLYPDGEPFLLQGRMDRLELYGPRACIVDYKTGTPPSKKKVWSRQSNQLPLLALIVQHGALEDAPGAQDVDALEYWKLSGSADKCEITDVTRNKDKPVEVIAPAQELLEKMVCDYAREEKKYAASAFSPQRYNDYAHLTRRPEWEPV
ncbi:MAG: double-strand break repair protein AddB, partial [Proteobacteria bacterium]|nr:double-strand break repair protein AddB [Pseudomonadota bacterium]